MMSVGFIFRLSCQAALCNRNAPVVGEWFTDLFLLTLKLRKLKMRTENTPEGNVLISRKLVDQKSFKAGVRRHLGWFHKGVFHTKWKGNNFPCCMIWQYMCGRRRRREFFYRYERWRTRNCSSRGASGNVGKGLSADVANDDAWESS